MGVLVVGLGFSGSAAATLLADSGYRVLAADPNPVIPHCTGIVSRRFYEALRLDDLVLSEPNVLILRLRGREFRIEAPRKAVVIDREELDRRLREAAGAAGAEILRRRVRRIKPTGEAMIDAEGRFEAIFDAEGAKRTLVADLFGRLGTVPGVQFDVRADRDPETVLIDLDVDGLFGRIVPLGENLARVGLATYSGHDRKLRRLLRVANATRVVSRRGGLVVISGPRGGLYRGRIRLIGDAAGVPKPLTGGGLAYGLLNVIEAVKHEDPAEYERSFMGLMSREYRVQRFLRVLKELSRRVPRAFYPVFRLIPRVAGSLDMDFRYRKIKYDEARLGRLREYLA